MAYQPKSYRKFLATSVTAALVATVAAPAIPSVSAASNFADQNQIPKWAVDAVDYLVDKGAIEGKLGNKFDPNGNLTRAEAAKILAVALGLDVDEDAKTEFPDAKDHWGSAYIAAIQDQLPGVIEGYNGNFRPNNNITRQELAKMVAEAYELELEEGTKPAISFSDNHGWGKEYVDILANLGIVQGYNDKFKPNDPVTRAETAVFVHRTEVPEVRVTPESSVLTIKNVTALDDTNRFLQITFSQKVNSLEPSDITIENAKSKERYGVKEVNLSSNGLYAQVELFSHEGANQVLEYLTDYNITVKANGKTLEYTFNRPAFINQRVVDYNVSDRQITVWDGYGSTRVLKVPKELEKFDYQSVLGEKVSVWHNKDNEVVDFTIAEETTQYDAIEITKTNEIKLLSNGAKHKFSKESFTNTDGKQTGNKVSFYLNGEEVTLDDGELKNNDLVGKKYNYAKVGLDKSGNVEFVSVYNLDQFLIVDRVEGNDIIGIEGDPTGGEFNAKDATIVKDNKVLALSDIKKGDILFFNNDANDEDGFAEVYNNSVKGEIESVFYESIRVDGKNYDYAISDEDLEDFNLLFGKAVYLKNDKLEEMDHKAAEELQAAGDVTIYLNRAGHAVYMGGDLSEVESNTKVSILVEDIAVDESFGKGLAQFEIVTEEGKEELHQVTLEDLKTISVNGIEYDIEKTPSAKGEAKVEVTGTGEDKKITLTPYNELGFDIPRDAEGKLVTVKYNSSGKVTDLEFFLADKVNDGKEGFGSIKDISLEPGDTYVDGHRLRSNTLVFDASDGYDRDTLEIDDIKAGDVTVTTWGEYKGSEIGAVDYIYNEKQEVVAIVIKKTTTSDQVYEEAVIVDVRRNADQEITEVVAFINGKKEQLNVNKVKANSLKKGDIAVFEFSKNNKNFVKEIYVSGEEFTERVETGSVKEIRVGSREVVMDINGRQETFRLVSDGAVLDISNKNDIETKALTDLKDLKNVTVVRDEKGSSFVKYFVYDKNEQPKAATKVSSVDELTEINVPLGSTLADVKNNELPKTVGITYDNGDKANVNVTWNDGSPTFNGNAAGDYTFTGTLTLPNGISADGKAASVKVTVAAAPVQSNDATLSGITLDGDALDGFDSATTVYEVELPAGTTGVPTVAGTATHAAASVDVVPAAGLPGDTVITVTAEDGSKKTYTIKFTVAE